MKTAIALVAVVSALAVATAAEAKSEGKFIGTPTCTGTTATNFALVTCSARVAGLSPLGADARLSFGTEWVCSADPSIAPGITTGNPISAFFVTVENGRIFTVGNFANPVAREELILGIDLGCPGDAWTAVRFTNVTIQLLHGSDISYNVGTVYPS